MTEQATHRAIKKSLPMLALFIVAGLVVVVVCAACAPGQGVAT